MNNDRFKFRVWDKDKKIIRSVILFENIPTEHPRKPILTYWDHPCEKTAAIKGSVQRVWLEDCILMQSTGLKDKNGKLIFEEDIILQKAQWSGGEQWDVYTYVGWGVIDGEEYTSGMGWVQNKIKIRNIKDGRDFQGSWGLRNFDGEGLSNFEAEIIGNIYENPELLEKK